MSDVDVFELTIPRIGEGLFSVKVIELHKQVGDEIKEDEVVYSLETDKTAVDIESSHHCILLEWLVSEQDVVEVGVAVARLKKITADVVIEKAPVLNNSGQHFPPDNPLAQSAVSGAHLSPRVRAYGLAKGLTLVQLKQVPAKSEFISPDDIDAFLLQQGGTVTAQSSASAAQTLPARDYEIRSLSKQQLWLASQFKRSQAEVAAASIVGQINMQQLQSAGKNLVASLDYNDLRYVSEFQILAYILAQVLADFPLLRSVLDHNQQLKEYAQVNLGLAVQADNGDLVTARIPAANTLDFSEFNHTLKEKISRATEGRDQASSDMSVILSYMGSGNLLFGAPLLVAPAVATLFFSAPDPIGAGANRIGYLSITFDHRVLNGMEIARFFDSFSQKIRHFAEHISDSNLLPDEPRPTSVQHFNRLLKQKVESLLNLPANSVDEHESLGVMGVDSIKALHLKEFIENKLDITLASTVLWHYPSIASLVAHCAEKTSLTLIDDNHKPEESVDLDALLAELGGLDDLELDALLQASE